MYVQEVVQHRPNLQSTTSPILQPDTNTVAMQEDDSVERQRIDEEITRLEAQIAQLRRRRNQLAPIMRPPADVLCEIMKKLPENNGLIDRIQVLWVSHHLRTLALQYPVLWTSISLPSTTPLCAEFLALSQSTPLAIEIQRTRFDHEYWVKAIPLLSEVTLAVDRCGRLYGPWKSTPNLRNLTSLTLRKPRSDFAPPLPEFYDTHTSLTRLRHLSLDQVLSALTTGGKTDDPPSDAVISLPSLISLELSWEPLGECIRFLNCAVFPLLTRLNIAFVSIFAFLVPLQEALSGVWAKSSIFSVHNTSHGDLRLHITAGSFMDYERSSLHAYSGDERFLSIQWLP
ncbi:hypothetical protein AX16_009357 [Volvariella volvacea WC 439]|nr:hypothetical protein AX16_009357 [Volvariella volvacea WC 439]